VKTFFSFGASEGQLAAWESCGSRAADFALPAYGVGSSERPGAPYPRVHARALKGLAQKVNVFLVRVSSTAAAITTARFARVTSTSAPAGVCAKRPASQAVQSLWCDFRVTGARRRGARGRSRGKRQSSPCQAGENR
jgi:hypothetical protein